MIYIVDANSLSNLQHFPQDVFPTLWDNIELLVISRRLLSVKEVFDELDKRFATSMELGTWLKQHKSIFEPPNPQEMTFVRSEIFTISHFQQLVNNRTIATGGPAADPWIVAKAKILGGCVVTEERLKPNAAKIPNVCSHFTIDCISLSEMLRREGWRF